MEQEWEQKQNEQEPSQQIPSRLTGAQARKAASSGRELYLNIRTLVTMMTIFILLFTFVARIIVVTGPSMENTLHDGDVLLVWTLGYNPKQGDIVVLTQKNYQEDSIVKRVIATEGQTVDIDYRNSRVYVDSKLLEEDYIKELMNTPNYPGYGMGINNITVPEGCIFVMGDNRNNSADSRYPEIGIIDTRCVIGQGVSVLFSLDSFFKWLRSS